MDERTSILMSLSASTAIHCIPCFEYYHGKALEAGITMEEMNEAVEIARKVKSGANLSLRKTISEILGNSKNEGPCCAGGTEASCCG